uniref:NADH-ubiquinone oxidoreductase chain 6 n=1 Tax=Lepturacanthus savala TaxID=435161 RepID=A0A6M8NP77_9SCOM|nr:NADH dehydrogenase subunit 6 [Lepturacanthus savala]QKG02582.1 NADH dehydrogenase subunit 6 [Lepturacanthus savala]WCP19613.1 NADH dehydrogenase subunit 6 [Lepturacanthus savala]
MFFLNFLFLVGLVVGLVVVSSNPSPFFAALGLVLVASMGCVILLGHGGTFLSLILFLIYLGGMLVVFAYSAALAAEPYPEGLGSPGVLGCAAVYFLGVVMGGGYLLESWYGVSWVTVDDMSEFSVSRGDVWGVSLIYSSGGGMLGITVGALLLTLIVVLHVVRGLSRGAVRAV